MIAVRYALVSAEGDGIYLGNCMGMGFWSLLDPVGQDHAVTFPTVSEALDHVKEWVTPIVVITPALEVADPEGYATIAECVAAGLPGWDPDWFDSGKVH